MKKPTPRKPRIPVLTKPPVVETLGFLNKYYGHDETFVKSWDANQRLSVLRALEVVGFVEITRLIGLKRWVVTPAGTLWLHMETTPQHETFSIDELLVEPVYGWMTKDEMCSAAETLSKLRLAKATDRFGGPATYFHMEPVLLTPDRDAVPGADVWHRFYKAPDPMEQYG